VALAPPVDFLWGSSLARGGYWLICLALAFLVAGCSTQQLYQSGQNYRQNQCVNLPQAMMKDCQQQTEMGYEQYRREVGSQEGK
jgi:hypothetical protein